MSLTKRKVDQFQNDRSKGRVPDVLISQSDIEYIGAFMKPFEKTGKVSPSFLDATLDTEPLEFSGVHVLHATERRPIHRIMTMDIESWGFRAERLHLGYIYNPEDEQPYKRFRNWHTPVKKVRANGERAKTPKYKTEIDFSKMGFFDLVNYEVMKDYLHLKSTQKDPSDNTGSILSVIYAHNGEKFDFSGVSYHARSNEDPDPEYRYAEDICEVERNLNFVKTGNQPTLHPRRSTSILLPWAAHFYTGKKTKQLIHPNVMRRHPVTFTKTAKFKSGYKTRAWKRDPELVPYLKKMLFESGSAGTSGDIRMRVYWEDFGLEAPSTANGSKYKYAIVNWRLRRAGSKAYIEVSIGNAIIRLVDSLWHLSVPLKALGSKGDTPLQYTDPEAWLQEEIKSGRINRKALMQLDDPDEFLRDYWFSHVDPEADEYCRQDCKILYDALQSYREMYGNIVKHPETRKPIDPLSYLTSAQSGLAAMVILSNPNGRIELVKEGGKAPRPKFYTQYYHEVFEDRNGRKRVRPSFNILQDIDAIASARVFSRTIEVPFLRKINNPDPTGPTYLDILTPGGFYQFGKYNKMYKHVIFGGRTEIFKPRNRKGTRVVSIDANSMYPSMMFDKDLRYPDPRYLRPLKEDIVGRKAILEHLKRHGGMYRINCAKPMNSLVHERYPVFPVRMEGLDIDSRLSFPSWDKEHLDTYVTSEELRYFLEITDVEGDDIRVIGKDSLFTSLLRSDETPFHTFAGAFYSQRKKENQKAKRFRDLEKEARLSGDDVTAESMAASAERSEGRSTIAKLILNSGGYGVNIQVNDEHLLITEGDHEGNMKILARMHARSRTWLGWSELSFVQKPEDLEQIDIIHFCKRWAGDQYRSSSRRDLRRDNMEKIRRLAISMPSKLAPHALRAFGAAITSHARVALHKAITGIDQVQIPQGMTKTAIRSFEVLYCDTDSVHFEVPEDLTNEQVEALLRDIKVPSAKGMVPAIKIGDNLGEWKIESHKANPNLLTDRVREHLDNEGMAIEKLDAFYVAPKHYYLTTKPDSDGNRHLIKEVVKGVPANATMMRCAMVAFSIGTTKLGDPFGLSIEKQTYRDLLPGIRNETSGRRRSYEYSDKLSKPLVLREPFGLPDGASYIDASKKLNDHLRLQARSEGIYQALIEYESVLANMIPVHKLRKIVMNQYDMITQKLTEDVYHSGGGEAHTEYHRAFRALKNAGLLDTVDRNEEIVL